MIKIFSPFEQFTVVPFIDFKIFSNFFGFIDLSITNQTFVIFYFVLIIYFFYLSVLNPKTYSLYMIPSYPQFIIEFYYKRIYRHFQTILKEDVDQYITVLVTLFIYLLGLNLMGMIPFSFSVTSQPACTVFLACVVYYSSVLHTIKKKGSPIFFLFLPSSVSFFNGFILFPIETLSFFIKPISMGLRLCLNMLVSHIMVKVLSGFLWALMISSGSLFFLHLIPAFGLVLILALDVAFCLVQAFIFTTLAAMFIKQILDSHLH